MTATQLIEELEWAIERNGGDDVEVRTAQQPKWAFEYSIDSAVTICEEDEESDDDRTPPKSVTVYRVKVASLVTCQSLQQAS